MKVFACAWLSIGMLELYDQDERPDADDILNTRPTLAKSMRQLVTKVVDELLEEVNEDIDTWISRDDVEIVYGPLSNGVMPVTFKTKVTDANKASDDGIIGRGNIWELEI